MLSECIGCCRRAECSLSLSPNAAKCLFDCVPFFFVRICPFLHLSPTSFSSSCSFLTASLFICPLFFVCSYASHRIKRRFSSLMLHKNIWYYFLISLRWWNLSFIWLFRIVHSLRLGIVIDGEACYCGCCCVYTANELNFEYDIRSKAIFSHYFRRRKEQRQC